MTTPLTPEEFARVRVSPDLVVEWTQWRTLNGDLVTCTWGSPDADGWFEPVFTRHPDDNLLDRERVDPDLRASLALYARALEVEHPILRGPAHGPAGAERRNPFSECHECALLNDFTNGRLPLAATPDHTVVGEERAYLEDVGEAVVAELVGVESSLTEARVQLRKAQDTLAGGLNHVAAERLNRATPRPR